MLLAIDTGNTNTVIGLYRLAADTPAELVADWRITTSRTQTVDEYGILFRNLFSMRGMDFSVVDGIIISSVVPPLDSTLRQLCERYFNLRPLFIEPGIKTGLPVLVDHPAEVGADRIVNSVAAYEKYRGPAIVVDLGTATTFDVISPGGEFLGGAIAPGLGTSADALFSRAARLTRVDVRKPSKVIGTSTTDNIQIGLYYGYIGLVDGILEQMVAVTGPDTKIIATGGLARLIAGGSRYITIVDEMLTLDGLRIIYERNRLSRTRSNGTSSPVAATTAADS